MIDAHIATTIGVFLVVQLVAAVWWASRTTTLLSVMQKEVKEILIELKAMRENYVPKSQCQARCILSDKEHEAMWKKIDELNRLT